MTPTKLHDFSELLPDAAAFIDDQLLISHVNRPMCRLLNYRREDLVGQSAGVLVPEDIRDKALIGFSAFRASALRQMPMTELPIVRIQMSTQETLLATVAMAKMDADGVDLMVAFLREVPKELSQFKVMAESDELTGVANRLLLSKRIKQLLGADDPFGLLYLDLNGFKPINDTWGHHAGDQVLKIVAQRMKRVLRDQDLVARVGGDEFAILLPGALAGDNLAGIAEKVHTAISATICVGDFEGVVGVAIGGVVSQVGWTEMAVMKQADQAMYRAKRTGQVWCLAEDVSLGRISPGPETPQEDRSGPAATDRPATRRVPART